MDSTSCPGSHGAEVWLSKIGIMKFREPLELTCPRCDRQFDRALAWIRQPGQRCPYCSASLASIRDKIESMVTEWDHFVEDAARILAIEEEFEVSIPDSDAEALPTFGEAHDYLLRRLTSRSGATAAHR